MSEFIQNEEYKQKELAKIIERLHNGESVARVKKDFDTLIKNVSPEEIAAMEQALMENGLPPEEIQRLCEVHVSVFEQSLEKQGAPEKVPGHPIHTFMAENQAARQSLARLRSALWKITFPWSRNSQTEGAYTEALLDFRKILIHYTRKENQLFPFLEQHGFTAPSKVMWGKHDEVRELFRNIDEALQRHDWGSIRRYTRALAWKATKMFFMEEKILFPAALEKLTERDWITLRRGEGAIGYAWVTPGGAWDPDIAEAKLGAPSLGDGPAKSSASAPSGTTKEPTGASAATMPFSNSETPIKETGSIPKTASVSPEPSIPLGEGRLSPEQIDLMLKALPIDVSFVDEYDRVQYYSDTEERIFPRSPAVIGRDVANCHPPKSVHIVKKILDAFKNKQKKSADFWIQMGDKFIYIRYYPVYGADGNYKGTVEVSQDVTGIRALEGQRRLLEWD